MVINRADIIEGMTKDELIKIKGKAGLLIKVGDCKLLEKFKIWRTWYRQMNQGKMTTKRTLVFDEDNIYEFDPNASEVGIKR